MDDHRKILDILRSQERAIANANASGAVEALWDAAVIYDLPPPLGVRGVDARNTDALNEWFITWANGVTVELPNPTIIIDRGLAVVVGLRRMRGEKKKEGPLDQRHRRTVIFQRRSDQWQIIHSHDSFPMAMDGSGKAITNLKP